MVFLSFAPADLVVATTTGIPVRLAGVELIPGGVEGPGGVRVTLDAVRGDETWRRDQSFSEARARWAERVKDSGSAMAGPPPTMPAVAAFERVEVLVSDDVGTGYSWDSGQVAGDTTEWSASSVFAPAPPREAQRLTLRFTVDGTPTTECHISLDAEHDLSTR